MTFEQAVGKIQDTMKDVSAEKLGNIAVQVEFTNNDCKGIMYISTRDGSLDIKGYDYKDCDAAIEVLYGDLSKVLNGRLSAATALERGTVVLSGNPDAFLALSGCAKKPAVKKATASKATKKVEAPETTKKACGCKTAKAASETTEKKTAAKAPAKTAAKKTAAKKTTK